MLLISRKETTMAFRASLMTCMAFAVFLVFSSMPRNIEAQLSSQTFYSSSCPNALTTIRTAVRNAINRERRMGASLIRLHFHDCFVQGCDASVLLDSGNGITSEKGFFQNADSIRGFEVIDQLKSQLEQQCPQVVSCADILAVAARDASEAVGGPSWNVNLGRRDSTAAASRSVTEGDLPRATDNLQALSGLFRRKGFTEREMVALSGAHSIGQAKCITFIGRVNDPSSDLDPGLRANLRTQCRSSNNTLVQLDSTANQFDNLYFVKLTDKEGLLQSDQSLYSGGSTNSVVEEYEINSQVFFRDFSAAMVKMGDMSPLTGTQGQIRRVCTAVN